jgi:hypothetical protein
LKRPVPGLQPHIGKNRAIAAQTARETEFLSAASIATSRAFHAVQHNAAAARLHANSAAKVGPATRDPFRTITGVGP